MTTLTGPGLLIAGTILVIIHAQARASCVWCTIGVSILVVILRTFADIRTPLAAP